MKRIAPTSDVPDGAVIGFEKYAVGNNGEYFAVTRHCRHLNADLADGTIDDNGCLVCPWHGSRYDVTTGRMVQGPGGAFAKVPGLGAAFKALTKVAPLGVKRVEVREDDLFLDD